MKLTKQNLANDLNNNKVFCEVKGRKIHLLVEAPQDEDGTFTDDHRDITDELDVELWLAPHPWGDYGGYHPHLKYKGKTVMFEEGSQEWGEA